MKKSYQIMAAALVVAAIYFINKRDETEAQAPQEEPAPVEAAVQEQDAEEAVLLELPSFSPSAETTWIAHKGFTLLFSKQHNEPLWVAWDLRASELDGDKGREGSFYPDPLVPEAHQVTTNDYKGCGYDRGHMCPAADMKWDEEAMHDCFLLTNVCPQTGKLNQRYWRVLEEHCRDWARQEGTLYICCGPLFESARPATIGKHVQVTVPDGFFKVILSLRPGAERAIAFYYANGEEPQTMRGAACSVDEMEKRPGLDFFYQLSDSMEQMVEASFDFKSWKI